MQKNYPFFETTLPQPLTGIFQKNNVNVDYFINKIVLQRFFVLFFLIVTSLGFSQTEHFETGIPTDWLIMGRQAPFVTPPTQPVFTNSTFTSNWVPTPTGGYSGTGGAVVNPSLNNTQNT